MILLKMFRVVELGCFFFSSPLPLPLHLLPPPSIHIILSFGLFIVCHVSWMFCVINFLDILFCLIGTLISSTVSSTHEICSSTSCILFLTLCLQFLLFLLGFLSLGLPQFMFHYCYHFCFQVLDSFIHILHQFDSIFLYFFIFICSLI